MNLNLFYSKFIVLLFSISILFGKALRPESNFEHLEILSKNNKHKEYFEITKDGLEYYIKGPAEIKIFSKAAFPKKNINEIYLNNVFFIIYVYQFYFFFIIILLI